MNWQGSVWIFGKNARFSVWIFGKITSLAAIYEQFTREDIGCRVERLWAVGVSDGNRYEGRHCTITREAVYRKSQNKK